MFRREFPVEILEECFTHLPPKLLSPCLSASRLFWQLSRPWVFREMQVQLYLWSSGQALESQRLKLLKGLLQPEDAQYAILPLVKVLSLQVDQSFTEGITLEDVPEIPIREEELGIIVELFTESKLSSFSLEMECDSWAELCSPLRRCFIRLLQLPTLRSLSLYGIQGLPCDILNGLPVESLRIGRCRGSKYTPFHLRALPLKRLWHDHSFPLFEHYFAPILRTTKIEKSSKPYPFLVEYGAASRASGWGRDKEILLSSFMFIQELDMTLIDMPVETAEPVSLDLAYFPHLLKVHLDLAYRRKGHLGDPPSELPAFVQTFLRPSSKPMSLQELTIDLGIRDEFGQYACISPATGGLWGTLDQALTQPNLSEAAVSLELRYCIIHQDCCLHEDNLHTFLWPLLTDLMPRTTAKDILLLAIDPYQIQILFMSSFTPEDYP